MNYHVHFLDTQEDFNKTMDAISKFSWIGFDTEFVGEKTYIPVLCLIQVVTEQDIYLIDTLQINDLQRFLNIVSNPNILKITHAGDNDYRLLYSLYGTVPVNTFDTQIAAGFVGYNYPAGFGKIVERELRVNLAKSHTVANWEARPLDPKALDYAVEDVKYLPALHDQLTGNLQKMNREDWAREENRKWEEEDFYIVDPFKEVLANDYIHQLDFKAKVFLVRIYHWRREKAAKLNIPKEAVLQNRHISTVLRATKHGHKAFQANRTMPEGIWRKYIKEWQQLWQDKPTRDELDWLNALPAPAPDDPEHSWSMELVYHFVKHQCLEHEISAALLLPKGEFNKIKSDGEIDASLLTGWRATLLGENLVTWLQKKEKIQVNWNKDGCQLNMG
ncbi:MAG: ribonuclease D [Bacteroidetes bacterium]|nr:MAG: ribonuclease D [Bacteroidota bacterium]